MISTFLYLTAAALLAGTVLGVLLANRLVRRAEELIRCDDGETAVASR